jgi:hypothetical protein
VTLSARINDITKSEDIFKAVSSSLDRANNFNDVVQGFYRQNLQVGDIPGVFERLRVAAKRMEVSGLPDDPDFIQGFQRDLRAAQRDIDGLINPDTSTLRRAYQNVVDSCQKQAWKAVDRNLYYAAYYKQRYNANRILHTEAARAYGQGARLSAIRDPGVSCVKISLASDHDCECVCDVICNADLYGYGPGVFPADHGPDYPFHPFCHCLIDSIYVSQVPAASGDDYDPDAVNRYLKSLDADKRAGIMGKGNAEEFMDEPDKWRDLLPGWQEPTDQTPDLKQDMVFSSIW